MEVFYVMQNEIIQKFHGQFTGKKFLVWVNIYFLTSTWPVFFSQRATHHLLWLKQSKHWVDFEVSFMNFTHGTYRHVEKMKLYVGTSRLDVKACQSYCSHKTVGAVRHTSSLARNVQRPRQVLKKKKKKSWFIRINFFKSCVENRE